MSAEDIPDITRQLSMEKQDENKTGDELASYYDVMIDNILRTVPSANEQLYNAIVTLQQAEDVKNNLSLLAPYQVPLLGTLTETSFCQPSFSTANSSPQHAPYQVPLLGTLLETSFCKPSFSTANSSPQQVPHQVPLLRTLSETSFCKPSFSTANSSPQQVPHQVPLLGTLSETSLYQPPFSTATSTSMNLLRRSLHYSPMFHPVEDNVAISMIMWQSDPNCEVSNKGTPSTRDNTPSLFSTGNRFKCGYCNYNTKFKYILNLHLQYNHPEERDFTCDTCGERFVRELHLKHHMVFHFEERPFKCHACPREFKLKVSLTHHMKTHIN